MSPKAKGTYLLKTYITIDEKSRSVLIKPETFSTTIKLIHEQGIKKLHALIVEIFGRPHVIVMNKKQSVINRQTPQFYDGIEGRDVILLSK